MSAAPGSYSRLINVLLALVDDDAVELAAALRLSLGRIVRKIKQTKTSVGNATLFEASVVARLDRDGPASPGALAAAEGVRPQAMAATLATLEERRLIDRGPDPADGRRSVVTLTDAGRRIAADRRSVSVQRMAAALEGFSADDRERLAAMLPLLDRLGEAL